MIFSQSFYIHFIFNLLGFLLIGIYLCRGSWRNKIRGSLPLGLALIAGSHLGANSSLIITAIFAAISGACLTKAILDFRRVPFVPSEVREGHNVLSMLAGAALFALTVQLHAVLFGVPVFQLVK